jgi:hypothetical protein
METVRSPRYSNARAEQGSHGKSHSRVVCGHDACAALWNSGACAVLWKSGALAPG